MPSVVRQYELVERVRGYDPNADEAAINRAYVFAMQKHGHQKRASGDPYYSHPIEVAGILSEMRLDGASIVTALLHDTVEDTDTSLAEIETFFGPEIRRLVDGVTKLTRIEQQSDATRQAENFRKLVLAMSEDIRVLLVKLADRLHNMRTIGFIKSEEKRRRIALETVEIYSPLSERMGIASFKDELEDRAFAVLNSDARNSVLARLAYLRDQGGTDLVERIITELGTTFQEAGITATVTGREKTAYSIWRKMQRKNVSFEQLSDIMAFRCSVDCIPDCYVALGVIHGKYPVIPERFKDFISTPKPNGYRSLHTTVLLPESQRIEVQIRTHDMHQVAERGVAAHWAYKEGAAVTDGRQYEWLRELLDILEQAEGPEEFLEHTKLAMFQDQVFCFTPRGDLTVLPRGATAVDFAYAVHSEVGDTCTGARVNGRLTPLRQPLANGDQVEIITSKKQTPSPTWEEFVVTAKARARIRRFVRLQKRSEFVELGRSMLDKTARQDGVLVTEKILREVLPRLGTISIEDLHAEIGEGLRSVREVTNLLKPQRPRSQEEDAEADVIPLEKVRTRDRPRHDSSIPIEGLIPGMAVHFARCCHPLPGDRIVGIVTTGKGVTIHTIDCETLAGFAESPERWIDVSWGDRSGDDVLEHTGRLSVVIANAPGSLGTVSTVIGRSQGNISNLKITSRSQDFFDMLIDVQVRDVKHLTMIVAALRATPVINSVERARG